MHATIRPPRQAIPPYPHRAAGWLTGRVSNPEHSTRISSRSVPPTVTLERLPLRQAAVVRAVDAGPRDELAQYGIVPGVLVRAETRAPFGGPVVIRVGRARVAMGRAAARSVLVQAVTTGGPTA